MSIPLSSETVTSDECPRLYPMRILARKWSYLVLRSLQKPLTFSALQRELRFITNSILSRELKMLEQEKLICVTQSYALTPAGEELLRIAEPLMEWSVQYAGCRLCPQERNCGSCLHYPDAVGARVFVRQRS